MLTGALSNAIMKMMQDVKNNMLHTTMLGNIFGNNGE